MSTNEFIEQTVARVKGLGVNELDQQVATDIMGWEATTETAPGDIERRAANERQGFSGIYVSWAAWDCGRDGVIYQRDWRPHEDRNHSRRATDKVMERYGPDALAVVLADHFTSSRCYLTTALEEAQAALIVNLIYEAAS